MKYCFKCGNALIEDAKFCNTCGQATENPYTKVEAPKTENELRAEEQALLDKFSLGLKHERLAWKIYGIVWIIITAYIIALGLIIGIFVGAAATATGGESFVALPFIMMYSLMGFLFLPIGIINLSMKNKVETYRAKLYSDCKDGIGHFSVGSIVFCAFFNEIALIFNIVYFIQAKNNAAVIERIKARQNEYNSQQ
ncbi:MAG: hypothetical protein IKK10_02480 [Clostridia bacterium]|nr:hypothetical protein [Clostridia bacterium]